MKNVRFVLLLAAALLLLNQPGAVEGCGPFKSTALFVDQQEPDSLAGFLSGKLQIVSPGLRKKYLFVAYRFLSGKPLSAAEQKALQGAWEPPAPAASQQSGSQEPADPLHLWLKDRSQVPGAATVTIDPQKPAGSYQSFTNCTNSAFESASHTLQQRSKQFGAQSQELKLWLEGQDKVFSNCGDKGSIPDALPSSVAAMVRADREYQIGTAYFYAGDWDHARQQLQRVASDRNSPWKQMAPYVAARALVRKATLQAPEEKNFDPATLTAAETELQGILAKKDLASIHPYARQILNFVTYRLHPEQRHSELDQELSTGQEKIEDLSQDLTDYLWLGFASGEMSKGAMSQWIAQMSSSSLESDQRPADKQSRSQQRDAIVQTWREHKDLTWLVAALSVTQSGDPGAADLLAATKALPENSPGYLTVRYHQLRLSGKGANSAGTYSAVSTLLEKHRAELTPSTTNAFLAIKLESAPDLESFIANLPRRAVYVDYGDATGEPCSAHPASEGKGSGNELCDDWLLDETGEQLVNRLPLNTLLQVAHSEKLSKSLHAEILKVAWTKAALLENHDAAKSVASDLAAATPETKALLTAYLSPSSRAADDKTADEKVKHDAALFALLHLPGLRPYLPAGGWRTTPIDQIDNFRENWWCSAGQLSNFWAVYSDKQQGGTLEDLGGFLTAEQKKQADTESVKLRKVLTGPNYLTAGVLQWAKESPDDQRLPEALHLAVRSTRYGCSDKETRSLSKQAFDVLHRRFPQSTWTKQTPYYYGTQ